MAKVYRVGTIPNTSRDSEQLFTEFTGSEDQAESVKLTRSRGRADPTLHKCALSITDPDPGDTPSPADPAAGAAPICHLLQPPP